MSRDALSLVVEQTAPVGGRVDENARRISDAWDAATGADLVVLPELALTGYLVGEKAPELGIEPGRDPFPVEAPDDGPALALGYVERGRDRLTYNAAVVLGMGKILARHRKVYLPTYGMFDEGRIFARGREGPPVFRLQGWRVGLLICEELWHPALPYLLALEAADLIVVLAAAAGRGRPETDDDALFASAARWELLARAAAANHGVWLVLANRAGVEGGLTFAGGSLVVAPSGEVVARAPQGREGRIQISLDRDAVAAARHPFSHLRDEDPSLVIRELRRITGLA